MVIMICALISLLLPQPIITTYECLDITTRNYDPQCKQNFTLYSIIGLNMDDQDEAFRIFSLIQPILDPCIQKNLNLNSVSNLFFFDSLSYMEDMDCPYLTFEATREIESTEDLGNGSFYSFFETFRSGYNIVKLNDTLNRALNMQRDCFSSSDLSHQPVIFIFLDLHSDIALLKFDGISETITDSLLLHLMDENILIKIIWTVNHTLNPIVKEWLDYASNLTNGYVSYVVDDFSDSGRSTEAFGMCAVPPVDDPVEKRSMSAGMLSLLVVIGLLILFIIIAIILGLLFTMTTWLDWPAFWVYSKLENLLGFKLRFLIRRMADHTDNGFERYVKQWKRHIDEWEVNSSDLHISSEKLGTGAFADVFSGFLVGIPPVAKINPQINLTGLFKDSENQVAIKKPKETASPEEKWDFLRETAFMKTLDFHPHILSMLGCSTYPLSPFIVSELCEMGDLLTQLQLLAFRATSNLASIQRDDFLPIIWQISDAMVYLATKYLIHRDLAARNILLTKGKVAKLSDFGLCRRSQELMYKSRKTLKLPMKWMAPESIEKAEYSEKSDIWSFGVLLYEIYSLGAVPYPSLESKELLTFLKNGNRLEIPRDTPDFIEEAMMSCWNWVPFMRPSAQHFQSLFYSKIEQSTNSYGYLHFGGSQELEDGEHPHPIHFKKASIYKKVQFLPSVSEEKT